MRRNQIELTCAECGKRFSRKASDVTGKPQFCGIPCAAIGRRKLYSGANSAIYNSVEVPCDFCGATLTRTPSNIRRYKVGHFCDGACYGKWRSANMVGEKGTRYNRVPATCVYCGTEFTVTPSQVKSRGNFCTHKCYGLWRSATLIGPDSPIWKGGRLPYYGPNWHAQRDAARQRDGDTCQQCGKTKEDIGQELDVHHKIPFRLFGIERYEEANELANLISLCKKCHVFIEHHPMP